MITQDGFHDFAVRELLPADRIYPWRNTMRRIYHHSLEGQLGFYRAQLGFYRAYNDPARHPTGWTGTVGYNGTLYQHAAVWAGLAHGGPNANPHGPGYEAEGVAGEPLTTAQVATYRRIHADLAAHTGYTYVRDGTNRDFRLVEHGEAAPTACPSGRYAPLWESLNEEEELPDPRVDKLIAALGGEAALDAWNERGNSLLLGYADEQQKLGEHLANHAAGVTGMVPEHSHQPGKVVR